MTNRVFKYTINRLPTEEELTKFNNTNLNADEILDELKYAIIGRGITSKTNIEIIREAAAMLIVINPNDERYINVLIKANELKSK